MDPLHFIDDKDLLTFFHCKKTEMSCIEQPFMFLTQLRDHHLIPEDRYQKIIRMKSQSQKQKGVYQVLDWVENQRSDCIKLFWTCVFEDHILRQYPTFQLLKRSLIDGTFDFSVNLPEKEETFEEPKKEEKSGKKNGKRRESGEEEEEDPGPSTKSTPSKKKKYQKPTYNSPIRKGSKEDIWNWPLYKVQLPVTCGDKKGTLHRDKLANGERCIFAEKRWFTPQTFEDFGGKKSSKNWKTSIRCQDTPLLKLIQEGHLSCPRFPRRRLTYQSGQRRRRLEGRQSEDTVSVSDTESEDEEEEEEEGESGETETDANRDVEGQDDVPADDMSEFRSDCLSVTCGAASGTLHKYRFSSGAYGKCIRTEEKWLTPAEFVQEDAAYANTSWLKSIVCQGTPLSVLVDRRVLIFHSLLCKCRSCSKKEEDLLEQRNDDNCFVCRREGDLVCCDQCPRAFHSSCHLPALDEGALGENWLCTYCVLQVNQPIYASDRTLTQALESSVSDFMLQCQYLLLQLYHSDEQHIFSADPCDSVPRYREFIRNPMWLDKVAEKLGNRSYTSVQQFYSDVTLIFKNCAKFNRDNEFGKLGTGLSQLFHSQFRSVFSVQQ